MPQEKPTHIRTDLDSFEVFPWNRNFETGHALIDNQHRTLVELLNKLAETLVSNETTALNQAFDTLADYAGRHFDDEEEIWADYFSDDGWLSSHQMSHAAFLPKVVEIKEQDSGTGITGVVEQIVKFLIRWLAFHIIDNDKRMALVVTAVDSGKSLDEAKLFADKKMSGSMRVLIETILTMYDGLSSRAIDLMRERHARIQAEEKLKLANKRLAELSITDPLTGLYNRRYFETVFPSEIRRARREKRPLTYILIDIDFFKRYNDNYGHPAGDSALGAIGSRLQEICRRPGDLVFRLGGEEFGILIIPASGRGADDFGEIVRTAVEDLKISHGYSETGPHMTVSVGLVTRIPGPADTMADYAEGADRRLYRAKALGRNRVVCGDTRPCETP